MELKDLIKDFLESNGLENKQNVTIDIRHKLYRDVPVTLKHVLEDFYEYLKTRIWKENTDKIERQK